METFVNIFKHPADVEGVAAKCKKFEVEEFNYRLITSRNEKSINS